MCLIYLFCSVHRCIPLFFHLSFFAVCGGNLLGILQTWVTCLLIQRLKQCPLKSEERLELAWLSFESRTKTRILAPWKHKARASSEALISPESSIEIHMAIDDAQIVRLSNSGCCLWSRVCSIFVVVWWLLLLLGFSPLFCFEGWLLMIWSFSVQ